MAAHRMLCARCDRTDVPDVLVPGSDRIELAAWCCLLVPGLLYALWRHASQRRICAHCGSSEVLRVTRAARRLRRAQGPAQPARQPELRFAAPRLAWLAPPLARLRRALHGSALMAAFGAFALLSVDRVRIEPAPVASAPHASQAESEREALAPKRARRECERLCGELHRPASLSHQQCQAGCVDGIEADGLKAISGSSSTSTARSGDTPAFGYHAPGERPSGSAPVRLDPDPRP